MSDGAHDGIRPQAAMGAPEPKRKDSTSEMAARIMSSTGPSGYDGTAEYCAKLIVEWLSEDPSRAQGPPENVYESGPNGEWTGTVTERGWYDRMKADGIPLGQLDLTGFMWGWAVNAARAIVELPPVPNPAIIEL